MSALFQWLIGEIPLMQSVQKITIKKSHFKTSERSGINVALGDFRNGNNSCKFRKWAKKLQ